MNAILPSRTGAAFMAEVDTESDGSITILSNDGKGYRSAHRDHAAEHFNHRALWCMNRLTWINSGGARVILTRWNTQEFRTRPRPYASEAVRTPRPPTSTPPASPAGTADAPPTGSPGPTPCWPRC